MEYQHPHFAGKTLGVIREEQSRLHPIDLVRAAVPPTRPSTYLLDPTGPFFTLQALMQSFTSQCGGYSLAQAVNFLNALFKNAQPQTLSGSFDYAYEKTIDGVPDEEGTTISAVGEAGDQVGSCLDTLFPDDGALTTSESDIITSPWSDATPAAKQDALSRLLGTAFALTDLSIAGIHQACFEFGAVILQVEMGLEWYTAPDGATSWAAADVLPIRPPAQVIDDHFILVAPYDEPNDRTWLVNSWSDAWAQDGFGYFTSDYAPFIKAGIAFKKLPPSVAAVLNSTAIESAQKATLIQAILTDIQEAVGLIQKEAAAL